MGNSSSPAILKSTDCSSCPIRHRALCSRCEINELEMLEQMKFYKTYPAGQTIAIRGDEMETVSSVVSGTATLTRVMEDGRVQMVGLLLPSDFIGRPGRATVPYDVTAVTDVTLCCFKRGPFEKMVYDTPHVGERLMEMALDELDAARDWMVLLGRKTAREKVSSFLALILRRSIPSDREAEISNQIELPITRDAMSTYLGLTIETVSRQMKALQKDGIIIAKGKKTVKIVDLPALIENSGDDEEDGMIIS